MSTKKVIITQTIMDRDEKGESVYYKPSADPVPLPVKLANELLKAGRAELPKKQEDDPEPEPPAD